MNRREPTTEERKALEKIDAIGARSPLLGLGLILFTASLQLLPERYATIAAIASVSGALCVIAVFVYRACFLRCPRCSGWVAIPKCPSAASR